MDIKPLILVIEDDKAIRNFILATLKTQGYKYIETENGEKGLAMIMSYNPDIIILDLGLPDMDGLEIISKVRLWSNTPIIVVSARGQEREKVEALDSGADDYITKPFGISELLARLRVSLRHIYRPESEPKACMSEFILGDLKINFEKRIVSLNNEEIHLTPIEYKLLTLLSRHAGKVLTHNFILKEVWGSMIGNETQSLRVFMASLRRKIEKEPAQPRYILTEVGVGYRMADE
ncbi:two-component system KDP operon response regulator KdpE [Anaerosolibacter carboniphilus]|uniref:Stage 0 sporulation protein A homolog n=1 Tax=Anaerosolibacter carboniphilus TaxID=1417629 RepID=A0A841KQ06_9FIRM|nr:response regulator [Anaerosolibacter carboniphilus]MBB6214180.1 two-component system KDP operon response regulator KdpE [Anaerosolibacter carboniphilus]